MNSLARTAPQQVEIQGVISTQELVQRIQRMKEVQKHVMKPDTHYGKIPGCPKDSLWQPGAQVLCVAFNVGSRPYQVEDLSVPDEVRYRVTLEFFHQGTTAVLGYGVGECSSAEDKYSWRKPVCEAEFDATPEDRRRIKFFRDGGSSQQIRTNPADTANTVLKMAKKRALVNGTLDVLAASEIFSQDLEDLPPGMDIEGTPDRSTKPETTAPRAKQKVVQDVSTKTGTGKNGPWTKYGVKIDGKFYGTFDKKLGEAAMALKGKPVVFESTNDGKYDTLTSIAAADAPQQAAPTPADDDLPFQNDPTPKEAFLDTLRALAMEKGVADKVDSIILAEFGCTAEQVVLADYNQVLEHFKAL